MKLKDLIKKITPQNIHPETKTGIAIGKEVLYPYNNLVPPRNKIRKK